MVLQNIAMCNPDPSFGECSCATLAQIYWKEINFECVSFAR